MDGELVGGRYRLLRSLGEGAAAKVYAAESQLFGQVALKMLHEPLARDEEVVQRFVHEARAASAVQHPNVVRVFDLGRHGRVPFMVMELCEGETLREVLDARGAVGPLYACELVTQILSALEAAHSAHIVHRDLKPANVMVVHPAPERPVIKVLDFGIAKRLLLSDTHDDAKVFGTPSYMAPEQIRLRPVDHRADLYAVGALLYELLTGKPPFRGATPAEVMTQVISRPPMPLRASDRALPRDLDELVRRCLAKNPARRPSSARELSQALERYAGGPISVPPADRASHEPVPLMVRGAPPETEAIPLRARPKKNLESSRGAAPRLELVAEGEDEGA